MVSTSTSEEIVWSKLPGEKEQRKGYRLRWWDKQENLLLWGVEIIAQERQRSEKLAAKLRELGENPDL